MNEPSIIIPDNFLSNYSGAIDVRINRKEKHFSFALLVLAISKHGQIRVAIESRFYNTAARSYNCTWIEMDDIFCCSAGSYAGGYQYHKNSQSLENTLNKLGIVTDKIGGYGDNAMESALLQVATSLNDMYQMGYSSFKIITVNP